MKHFVVIALALFAGFIGGILGTRISQPTQPTVDQIVRAHSFELVNAAGETISFWGVDQGNNIVLAFGGRGLSIGGEHPRALPAGLANPDNQLTAFGLQGMIVRLSK